MATFAKGIEGWSRLVPALALVGLCAAALVPRAGGPPSAARKAGERVRVQLPPRSGEVLPSLGHGRIRATRAYEREYWYAYERSFPGGVFPRGAELAARRRAEAFRERAWAARWRGGLSTRAANLLSGRWSELGPRELRPGHGSGIVTGRLTCILLQRAQNRILVGSASGGIWKRSLTPGARFTPTSDFAPSLSIGALAADPADPDVIYAGTGEPGVSISAFGGSGLLRSADGGDTWSRVDDGTFTGKKISQVWVDPRSSRRLLVAALHDGLYESEDGGVGWTRLLEGGAMTVAVSPTDPDRLLFSDSEPYGSPSHDLKLSTDGGRTFRPVEGPWRGPGLTLGRIDLAWAPAEPGVVWAAVAPPLSGTDGGRSGLYRSTDGGATFSRAAASLQSQNGEGQGWYNNTLAVSPTDSRLVYVGGINLYRARFGETLRKLTHWYTPGDYPYVHADQHALAIDPAEPQTIYAGNDGGLYVSRDGGATWKDMNDGLAVVQFYAGSVSPDSGLGGLLGGTQDNGSVRPLPGGQWLEAWAGDGYQCATDPRYSHILYASSYDSRYAVSLDAGRSFTPLRSLPFLTGELMPTISPLAIDPVDGSRVYGGAQRVYRGDLDGNGALRWTPLSPEPLFSSEVIRRIAIAPTDRRTLYVAGGARLLRTVTGTAPWSDVSPPLPRFITGVAVHPADPRYLVCSRSGYQGAQVVRSLDGGATWTDLTSDLPNIPANNVLLRAEGARLDAYLATDTGVYYADLNAPTLSWSPVGEGLPHVVVHDVLLANAGSTVIAVTHGRGMWALNAPAGPQLEPLLLYRPVMRGGTSTLATVSFTSPVSADTRVMITSSSRTGARVPPGGVLVRAGSSTADFVIRTGPVRRPTSVTLTAAAGGVTHRALLRLKR